MKTIFLDCNDQLAPVWQSVLRADDPPIDVNCKAFARDELPRVIDGYDIAIDDHSYMPTTLVAQCPELKHIVFLGTGPASYMNVGELEARGIKVHIIKGYGDTAVAEHSIALMVAAARDVARMDREVRARRLDAARGRATARQDARRDRPRRHRPRGRAHRQRHGHEGDRLEPHQACRDRRAAGRYRHAAGAKPTSCR